MDPDDPPDEDSSSDYGTSGSSSEFTSVTSSHLRHSYEHGRRYQGFLQDRYGLPNDDTEQTREAVKHRLYVDYMLEGKLIVAPVGNNPQKVVDLGTGVGIWAQEVAEHYPSARVIGTDLSPIQPSWSPPNCEFRVEDLEDDLRSWTSIYKNADLIHSRALLQTLRDPKKLLTNVFENLRPGGWYQSHESLPNVVDEHGNIWTDHPFNRLYELIASTYSTLYGWHLDIPYKIAPLLEETGFVNIHEKPVLVPLGRWHSEPRMREMGLFNLSISEDFVGAMLARHEALGLTEEQADEWGHQISEAFHDVRMRAQLKFVNCWGQRPPL